MTANAPGRDGMELKEAFSIVLALAETGYHDNAMKVGHRDKEFGEAIDLIRALAVGSFGLKE